MPTKHSESAPRTKNRRLEARIDDDTAALFSSAAQITGQTVSAFVIGSAREEARAVLGASSNAIDSLVAAGIISAARRRGEPARGFQIAKGKHLDVDEFLAPDRALGLAR